MKKTICTIFALLLLFKSLMQACTGIRLQAKDGSIIYARTLEFRQNLHSEILFIPRKFKFTGHNTYKNIPGLRWQAKYAVLGANALNITALLDGVNEKGLAGGIFYFPDYAQYQKVSKHEASHAIASWQLLTWILTTCASLDEVKEQLPHIRVSKSAVAGAIHPVHYIIHDPKGQSIVIEYTNGRLHITPNALGVITNSPDFNWHITNLRNYINLSAVNVPKVKLAHISLTPFGQGSGMLGLPGDFTPPSRFVRATAFSESVILPQTGLDTIKTAFHVLNLFDIPIGVVRSKNHMYNHTQWTSAIDLTTKKYYFHTYNNRQIFMIDLMQLKNISYKLTIPMAYQQRIINLTPPKKQT